ncbi:hypothetical protein EOI86_06455 [Hwanghaeella grinnelliae]|uniref:Uncharacterized protein n=1 Tax=Hwanghaeella grinnelliae TaxID=2500179 RepID=A0A437QWJ4_9PROT|nr:hypothetical protein [Hwanghaeella grinnelliae]RVU38904.1 hypothetical protein EOI86_06455 [Hwanghaeella grinnelliae]
MTPESQSEKGSNAAQREAEEMAYFGITSHPVTVFHYKDYRYTRLEDALAQARRTGPDAPADGRIGGHFAMENMGGAVRNKLAAAPDKPWCDTKGRNIVEGSYTQ